MMPYSNRCLHIAAILLLIGGCASHGPLQVKDPNWFDHWSRPVQITCNAALPIEAAADFLRHHVVELDELGKFRGHRYDISCNGQAKRIDEIISVEKKAALIREHLRAGSNAGKEVVLVVHGGLVSRASGLAEAANAFFAMRADSDYFKDHYPIFVNWRADAVSSYTQQLFGLRNGEIDWTTNTITSPIGLAADLGEGLLATPDAWIDSTLRFGKVMNPAYDACTAPATLVLCPTESRSKRPYDSALVTLPVRLVATPLVAGIGKETWQNMVRRTDLLFWREQQRKSPTSLAKPLVKGDFLALMEAFSGSAANPRSLSKTPMSQPVTLIGHSMGTIVAANLIGQLPDLNYQKIVLMAAALSIRDYTHVVYPLLHQNAQVQVYNLMLLPSLEATETYFGGIAPRGSLLEWIDELYEPSVAPMQKTLGKWVNVRMTLPTIPATLHGQITHRVFGLGDGQPQKHGEFNDTARCFWRESYWRGAWSEHEARCAALMEAAREPGTYLPKDLPKNLPTADVRSTPPLTVVVEAEAKR